MLNQDSYQEKIVNNLYQVFFHVFFLALFLISGVQFLERTIPFDGAFYCFKILKSESFNIEGGRWGAVYNQVIPIIGLKLGCSLNTFLILYSVSFSLCNYIFFLLIYYKLGQFKTSLAFVLLLALFYRYNFYYPVSEIHATIGPAFLLLGVLYKYDLRAAKNNWKTIALLLTILIWLLNIHILSICIISFIFAFFILDKNQFKNRQLFLVFAAGLAVFIFLISSISKNSYQGTKLESLRSINETLLGFNKTEGFKYLVQELPNNYIPALTVLLIMLCYYIFKKCYGKLLLSVISILLFFILYISVNVKYESTITMSNYYPVFGFFIIIPFVWDVIEKIRFRYLYATLVLVTAFSIFKIIKCGIPIGEEVSYHKRMCNNLRNFKERKFVLAEKSLDLDKIWMTWDMPFQSLIISSLNSADSSLTYYATKNLSNHQELISNNENAFIGTTFNPYLFGIKDLPGNFFHLKSTYYRLATSFQDSSCNELNFNKKTLTLDFSLKKLTLFQRMYRTIPVTITNNSASDLSCMPGNNKLNLCYSLRKKETKEEVVMGYSDLEVDIPAKHSAVNGLKIITHILSKGKYILEVDFTLNKKNFGSKVSMELTII